MFKEILVGSTCPSHSSSRTNEALLSDAKGLTTSTKESFRYENGLKATSTESKSYPGTHPVYEADVGTDSSLRARLLRRSRIIPGQKQFIPAGDLLEVLSIDAITQELQMHGLTDIPYDVLQHKKKIFAVLLIIHQLDSFEDFIRRDLKDDVLPFAMETINSHSIFSRWDTGTREQFVHSQWMLLAPVFSVGDHLKLHDDDILPFVITETIASSPFKGVHQIEIHQDHERFNKLGGSSTKIGHKYALKMFTQQTKDDNKRAFNQEIAIMRSMGSFGHDHVMKVLTTFEHSGRYAMIFPLAEENLRQFWARSNSSLAMSHWCLKQMMGLAQALSFIHNDLETKDSRPVIGCHMDLKPENILILKDNDTSKMIWKISDFGVSIIRPKASRLKLPPNLGVGTYEPPECQLDQPLSPSYDIWSLGCIFLECAIWMIKGSDAIVTFAEDRLSDVSISGIDLSIDFRDDHFFTLISNEPSKPLTAITRPAVVKCIDDLAHDPKCNEAISSLLALVKYGQLQVNQSKRLEAYRLSQRLQLIYHTTEEYLELGELMLALNDTSDTGSLLVAGPPEFQGREAGNGQKYDGHA